MAYRPSAALTGLRVGAHRGAGLDGQARFKELVPFERDPDGRRLDLRASARDPLGRLFVRRLEPRNAVTVEIVIDLTGSMGFTGNGSRLAIVQDVLTCLIASARTYRDPVGIALCPGSAGQQPIALPASLRQSLAHEAIDLLKRHQPSGRDLSGLARLPGWFGKRRRLIFLLSDFLWPDRFLDRLLGEFARHQLVALRIDDSALSQPIPDWGLAELDDLETGERRLVFLRPALKRQWREAAQARLRAQQRIFARHGRSQFVIVDRFDPEALSRHLRVGT